ncbi:MAG: Virginiamycin B lyase [Polyangiaceae bacterium]
MRQVHVSALALASLAAASSLGCNSINSLLSDAGTSNECTTTPPYSGPDAAATCTPVATSVVTQFPITATISSGPDGIVLGPDGNLWYGLEFAYGTGNQGTGNAIGRMSPDGSTQTAFAIPTPESGPLDVAVGPDGKIWFIEFLTGKIGCINTDGTGVTEFTVPGSNSQPNGITAGPDGNIWFTDLGEKAIGWMAPAGGPITMIKIPGGDVPSGIVAGPDGNIWFAASNKISKIATTPGAVPTEYAIPTIEDPHGIAVGPDGNIWFTAGSGHDIGRISLCGDITLFPVGATSWRIAAGPDGAMWFAENEAENEIGRITMSGAVTTFPVGSGGNTNTSGVALGPNGTVWYTETGNSMVGQITVCTGSGATDGGTDAGAGGGDAGDGG